MLIFILGVGDWDKKAKKGFPNNVQDPKWQSEERKDARHDGIWGVKVLFSSLA
jgi:hypothetical protein